MAFVVSSCDEACAVSFLLCLFVCVSFRVDFLR